MSLVQRDLRRPYRIDLEPVTDQMKDAPSVLAVATGLPESRYSQEEILRSVQPLFKRARHAGIIFEGSGVAYRHTVVPPGFHERGLSTEARNDIYFTHAVPLGEVTIRRCLDAAGLGPGDIDDFFVISCTGFDIPGLDLQLAGRLGMRPDLRRTCILGMGCYAAFPGLLRAREAVAGRPGRTSMVLALELCSLHVQTDDTYENVVCSALFSDGAGAAVIQSPSGTAGEPLPGPRLIDSATHCDYDTLDHMAFHLTDHGFQMRLSSYVPRVLAAKVEDFVDGLLRRNGLERGDVRLWGIHPGGKKILDHIQSRLGLTEAQVRISHDVLRDYGNMSSATILFVLDEIQRREDPLVGDYGVLMAFGPGLTMEAALLRW
jgi:predicted naringenin-chalcone synthase